MTRSQIAKLLALAAAFDSRTVGEADVLAWSMALDGLDYDRCAAAIVKHYRENTDRLMPAHIRRLARTTTSEAAICTRCKNVHMDAEACTVLVARPWPRAIDKLVRTVEAS